MKVYGIIGYPLSHSFSKKYFTKKFQSEKINDCIYETFPISSIDQLKQVIKKNPHLQGLNVTIPYKKSIFPYLDDSRIPTGLHACNCIKLVDGKMTGYNTDITGFEQSLLPLLKPYHAKALILGNGGAADAVKFVLRKLNIEYKIVSRQLHGDADLIYEDLNKNIIHENTIIINTTPLGTFPDVSTCPLLPYQYLTPQHLLFDLVYNPEKTLFLQKGEQQGAIIKNGYEMLIIQAEESWKIWNNGVFPDKF